MRGLTVPVVIFSLLAGPLRLVADLEPVTDAEALSPPTPSRLAALAAEGVKGDWPAVDAAARSAALAAYGRDRLNAAEGWYYVHRWAALFAESEAQFVALRWIPAVNAAGVGRANMSGSYATTSRELGSYLGPELQKWLLQNSAFSAEFFGLLSPVDYVPQVFSLLREIHQSDPSHFAQYASLALAIAVVYDLPPPPDWPHGQVSAAALPRHWPHASEAFAWWVREDQAGRTYQHLSRLGAEELKFVIDAAAPFAELEWSQTAVNFSLDELPQAYSMIRYRLDRAQGQTMIWPGATYRLSDILRDGGICIDQAYFATEAGKARGVPTLLFLGEGLDGRHAWFGYLDGSQRWQLDAGRYAEQRYLTGEALDPQTWCRLTDHEVRFLSERFRLLPAYRQSRIHAVFAGEFLQQGRAVEAVASARKAVNYERRNLEGWETLLTAEKAQQAKPIAIEATLREAALAFQRYPDLEAGFSSRLVASLRARGQTSLADAEESRLAEKYKADRIDLSIQQSLALLQRSFSAQPAAEQIRTYDAIVERFGHGEGIEFFDQIVVVFAEHLVQLGDRPGALHAVDHARQVLQVEPGSQLEQEFGNLTGRLQEGRAAR